MVKSKKNYNKRKSFKLRKRNTRKMRGRGPGTSSLKKAMKEYPRDKIQEEQERLIKLLPSDKQGQIQARAEEQARAQGHFNKTEKPKILGSKANLRRPEIPIQTQGLNIKRAQKRAEMAFGDQLSELTKKFYPLSYERQIASQQPPSIEQAKKKESAEKVEASLVLPQNKKESKNPMSSTIIKGTRPKGKRKLPRKGGKKTKKKKKRKTKKKKRGGEYSRFARNFFERDLPHKHYNTTRPKVQKSELPSPLNEEGKTKDKKKAEAAKMAVKVAKEESNNFMGNFNKSLPNRNESMRLHGTMSYKPGQRRLGKASKPPPTSMTSSIRSNLTITE
jgi:hypothetical protein